MNEEDFKKELTETILKNYHYRVPGLVWGQLKNYHDKLKLSYEGMYKTFLFVLEVKGATFENKYGLGLVKYYYREGHNYSRKQVENKPHVKTARREVVIKKQAHKSVVQKIDLKEIGL